MDNHPIVFLYELKIKPEDLEGLEDDVKAAFCLSCYAATEINAIMRLYVGACHELTGETAIDWAILSQRTTLLRIWSAKIFEFFEFIRLNGKYNKTKSVALKATLRGQQQKIDALLTSQDYKLAEFIRNEATNHYTLSAARHNLPHLSTRADLSLFVHEQTGNSFYPAGEELMFAGRVYRHASGNNSIGGKGADFLSGWYQWNLEAVKHVHETHLAITRIAIFERMKHRKSAKKMYFLKPRMAGNMDSRYPIFLLKHFTD